MPLTQPAPVLHPPAAPSPKAARPPRPGCYAPSPSRASSTCRLPPQLAPRPAVLPSALCFKNSPSLEDLARAVPAAAPLAPASYPSQRPPRGLTSRWLSAACARNFLLPCPSCSLSRLPGPPPRGRSDPFTFFLWHRLDPALGLGLPKPEPPAGAFGTAPSSRDAWWPAALSESVAPASPAGCSLGGTGPGPHGHIHMAGPCAAGCPPGGMGLGVQPTGGGPPLGRVGCREGFGIGLAAARPSSHSSGGSSSAPFSLPHADSSCRSGWSSQMR